MMPLYEKNKCASKNLRIVSAQCVKAKRVSEKLFFKKETNIPGWSTHDFRATCDLPIHSLQTRYVFFEKLLE